MKKHQLSPWSNNHLRFKAGGGSPQSSRFSSVIGQSNPSLRTTTAQREIEERAPVIKILNTTDPSPISGAFLSAGKFKEGHSNQSKGLSIPSQLLSNSNTQSVFSVSNSLTMSKSSVGSSFNSSLQTPSTGQARLTLPTPPSINEGSAVRYEERIHLIK